MIDAPRAAEKAFSQHRRNSQRRGIPFLFTFAEWWAWWQTDGRWERRGRGSGRLVMARHGDVGPYSPENVYCATQEENLNEANARITLEMHRERAARRAAAGRHYVPWAGTRGDGHPRSRPVLTPNGRFGSAALAADAHGINPATASERARKGLQGWRYADPSQA